MRRIQGFYFKFDLSMRLVSICQFYPGFRFAAPGAINIKLLRSSGFNVVFPKLYSLEE